MDDLICLQVLARDRQHDSRCVVYSLAAIHPPSSYLSSPVIMALRAGVVYRESRPSSSTQQQVVCLLPYASSDLCCGAWLLDHPPTTPVAQCSIARSLLDSSKSVFKVVDRFACEPTQGIAQEQGSFRQGHRPPMGVGHTMPPAARRYCVKLALFLI